MQKPIEYCVMLVESNCEFDPNATGAIGTMLAVVVALGIALWEGGRRSWTRRAARAGLCCRLAQELHEAIDFLDSILERAAIDPTPAKVLRRAHLVARAIRAPCLFNALKSLECFQIGDARRIGAVSGMLVTVRHHAAFGSVIADKNSPRATDTAKRILESVRALRQAMNDLKERAWKHGGLGKQDGFDQPEPAG